MTDHDRDRLLARRGRMVALVIAGAGLAAILAPYIVSVTGLAARFEFLIYLAAMAAFLWAFVVTWQIWRARRDEAGRDDR
jgi:MFS family permease